MKESNTPLLLVNIPSLYWAAPSHAPTHARQLTALICPVNGVSGGYIAVFVLEYVHLLRVIGCSNPPHTLPPSVFGCSLIVMFRCVLR